VARADRRTPGGKDGIVYSLSVTGDGQSVKTLISQQPWVASVKTASTNGTTALQVNVSDAGAAESQLLRLVLADGGTTVTEFGRKKHNLEEIFLNIVEGDKNGNRK
jgi:ABC-2 type transport system ATP-binding protein